MDVDDDDVDESEEVNRYVTSRTTARVSPVIGRASTGLDVVRHFAIFVYIGLLHRVLVIIGARPFRRKHV